MKKKVVLLGAGLVGGAIARDLADAYMVDAVDNDPERLDRLTAGTAVEGMRKDLRDPENVREVIRNCDLVINALPGFMGTAALKTVIAMGRNVVDIAFAPEDPLEQDSAARDRGVVAVVDCGVAPGLSNMILGYNLAQLKSVDTFLCLVGGLPVVREWPFEYKAVFSPHDVLELYTRPARYMESGQLVVRPALTGMEMVHFEGIGTLEAFNTDGLRTLLQTADVANMKEKTLRYPGHAQLMKVFRETGFFGNEPLANGADALTPLEFTSRILFPCWQMKPNEEDFTVMRVVITGEDDNGTVSRTYHLFDRYHRPTGTTSMARTTGYTCTAVARLILDGLYTRQGISPPEYVGREKACFEYVLQYLEEREVVLRVSR
ncbi:MAG: saccharopine dehydrogenase NADP-binding domain-containing protein [Acidobacteria bacterium]|nr:saccharopine dehydrogenase NADP-binding domain-containing protein [Acidobacteriota bacterium]